MFFIELFKITQQRMEKTMLTIDLKNKKIGLKNITRDDLEEVLAWYNRYDEYMFATGFDREITLNELKNKYLETVISTYDFFVWIINSEEKKIGILKGSIRYQEEDSLWINSIIIDSDFRRKGYGRCAIESLIDYASGIFRLKKIFVSVAADNVEALKFWENIGFSSIKKIEKHILLGGIMRDILIMQRIKEHTAI